MTKPQQLPYKKSDLFRAFKMFADKDAPSGCISPDSLERALVSTHPLPWPATELYNAQPDQGW
jgi:hypothetical protein